MAHWTNSICHLKKCGLTFSVAPYESEGILILLLCMPSPVKLPYGIGALNIDGPTDRMLYSVDFTFLSRSRVLHRIIPYTRWSRFFA